jgi:BA14K-like protein
MLNKVCLLALGTTLFSVASLIPGSVNAMPVVPLSGATTIETVANGGGVVHLAQMNDRKDRKINRADRRLRTAWDRNRDGRRCERRYGNCRHFYRGRYYETPWWTLPLIVGAGIIATDAYDSGDYSSQHVEWCFDRYRSYNPRYNTWVAYSGEVRQCNSPYL